MRSNNIHLASAVAAFCLTAVALLSSCGCGGSTPQPTGAAQSAEQLRTASEQVTLSSGETLKLAPYLWRDFQPISPVDGKPMIAVFRVEATGQNALPTGLKVENAWVILGDDVWKSEPAEEYPREAGSPSFEVVSRNGPKWPVGSAVDAIVQVRDQQNTLHRLQARQQTIHRTD